MKSGLNVENINNMKILKNFIGCAFLLSVFFVQIAQSQSISYPNELKGYEFFGKGKLKSLKSGISTRQDVRQVFGELCENACDYDSDWTINFSYYENNWIKEISNEKGKKTVYQLDPKYIGRLRKIEIRPKMQKPFAGVLFSNKFQKLSRSLITNDTSLGKGKMVTYDLFQDTDGLTYELFNATDYDTLNQKNDKLYSKGDLFSIQYAVSKNQEKEMFILQNNKK